MHKIALVLLSTTLMASVAYAGGGIFGGGKHKSANINGVYAIGVHVCSSLECPPVRIVAGACDGANMQKRYGVCTCEKGYVAKGNSCEPCEENYISDGITGCQKCPDGTYAKAGDTECTPCPEPCGGDECCLGPEVCGHPTKGGFKDYDDNCYSCLESDIIRTPKAECNQCENREWVHGKCYPEKCDGIRDWHGDDQCYPCSQPHYSFYYPDDCARCSETDHPYFYANGSCVSCFSNAASDYTGWCDMCGDIRTILNGRCVIADCSGFRDRKGTCWSCSTAFAHDVSLEECSKCAKKGAPYYWENNPNTHDSCTLCAYNADSYNHVLTLEQCAMCSGRYLQSDGRCRSCDYQDGGLSSVEGCALCDGTDNPRFLDSSGYCYPCSEPDAKTTSDEQCAKCGDMRTYDQSTNKCSLAKCLSGYFRSSDGSCYECSTDNAYEVSSARECLSCKDINGNSIRKIFHYEDKDYCGILDCPPGALNRPQYHLLKGTCRPCGAASSHPTSLEECTSCTERGYPSFMGTNEGCYPCSVSLSHESTEDSCSVCNTTSTPRTIFENNGKKYCALVTCPEGYYRGTYNVSGVIGVGSCGWCSGGNNASTLYTTAEECSSCKDSDGNSIREIVNGKCFLKE